MPTYEYQCEKCGFEFEQFQRMSAEPLKICPQCRKKSLHRKISGGVGVIFKGSGFYINDYGSKNISKDSAKSQSKDVSTPAQKSKEKTAPESTSNPKDSHSK